MEIYLIVGFATVAFVLFMIVTKNTSDKRKVFRNNIYSYVAKSLPMTKAESDFFVTLESTVNERYYVFPQMHLSAVLDHKVHGQDWGYAFRHINGKSVDFVLCDKLTLRPTYAIELDDHTHEMTDRHKRDVEVERIFSAANIPLVRFKDKDVLPAEIIQELSDAYL